MYFSPHEIRVILCPFHIYSFPASEAIYTLHMPSVLFGPCSLLAFITPTISTRAKYHHQDVVLCTRFMCMLNLSNCDSCKAFRHANCSGPPTTWSRRWEFIINSHVSCFSFNVSFSKTLNSFICSLSSPIGTSFSISPLLYRFSELTRSEYIVWNLVIDVGSASPVPQ